MSDRFASLQVSLKIPDLNRGDFAHLTITRQIQQVAAEFPSDNSAVILIGSSLGGLTAALLAEQYPEVQQLVLLAPAFDFLSHWLPKIGEAQLQRWQAEKYLSVYHYGEKRSLPLSYDFVVDAARCQAAPFQRPVPTLIFHGRNDEVIPIASSRDFARQRPWVKLIEFDSDHALANVMAEIWEVMRSHGLPTAKSIPNYSL